MNLKEKKKKGAREMLSGGKNARYSRSSVEFAEQGWGRGSHSSPGLESAAGGGADRSRTAKFTSK